MVTCRWWDAHPGGGLLRSVPRSFWLLCSGDWWWSGFCEFLKSQSILSCILYGKLEVILWGVNTYTPQSCRRCCSQHSPRGFQRCLSVGSKVLEAATVPNLGSSKELTTAGAAVGMHVCSSRENANLRSRLVFIHCNFGWNPVSIDLSNWQESHLSESSPAVFRASRLLAYTLLVLIRYFSIWLLVHFLGISVYLSWV